MIYLPKRHHRQDQIPSSSKPKGENQPRSAIQTSIRLPSEQSAIQKSHSPNPPTHPRTLQPGSENGHLRNEGAGAFQSLWIAAGAEIHSGICRTANEDDVQGFPTYLHAGSGEGRANGSFSQYSTAPSQPSWLNSFFCGGFAIRLPFFCW